MTWEASRSPANARTSHGARRARRRAHRRDRKSNNSYISKSRRISSVEPNPRPPRRGDHQRRSRRQSHDEPEGGAAGFRARENFLHCRSARPSGLGESCSAPAPSSPPAAGVVVVALFARVASTPPDVEDVDDEPLRSHASYATPVGDDDEVSAAFGCTTRDCCSPLGSSSSSVTRGALLAAFFALREKVIEITLVLLHRSCSRLECRAHAIESVFESWLNLNGPRGDGRRDPLAGGILSRASNAPLE